VRLRIVLAALLLFAAMSATADEEMRITTETSLISNQVTGNGRASSTLTPATNTVNTFGIYNNVSGETSQFYFNAAGRYTDDPRNDPEMYSLTNVQVRMSRDAHSLAVGDTFESFSQYSLSSALKGLSYKFKANGESAPEMTFVYGYAYPRWDSFNSSGPTRAIKRRAYGARVTRPFTQYFKAGLNYLSSDDSDRVDTFDPLYDTNTMALDWEYRPLANVSIRGENCYARSDVNPSLGAVTNTAKGSAHRVVFEGTTETVRLLAEYERVSPGFITLLGSATPDREKVKLRWRQKYSPSKTVTYGLLMFRDDLSLQKAYRTNHFRPEVAIALKNIFNRQYSYADLSYRFDRAFGGGPGQSNQFVNVGYRDRFGPYDADFNIGFTDYYSRARSESNEYVYNASISTRQTRGETVVRPVLYMGGSTISDELRSLTDQIWEISGGINVDVPKSNFSSSLKIGQNKLLSGASDNSTKLFGNLSLYYRPRQLARYNAGQLFLRVYVNDYSYGNYFNDFRETSVVGGLNLQY